MNGKHNKTIGVIFLMGFVSGAVFSYSGLLSFTAGFISGVMFTKTYWQEQPDDWVEINENQDNAVYTGLQWAKNFVSGFMPKGESDTK